jgi:hypothetical protein
MTNGLSIIACFVRRITLHSYFFSNQIKAEHVGALGLGLTDWSSNLGRRGFSPDQTHPHKSRGPPSLPFNVRHGDFLRLSGRSVTCTIYLHLAPRLRLSGAISLLPLFVFMACTEQICLHTYFFRMSENVDIMLCCINITFVNVYIAICFSTNDFLNNIFASHSFCSGL